MKVHEFLQDQAATPGFFGVISLLVSGTYSVAYSYNTQTGNEWYVSVDGDEYEEARHKGGRFGPLLASKRRRGLLGIPPPKKEIVLPLPFNAPWMEKEARVIRAHTSGRYSLDPVKNAAIRAAVRRFGFDEPALVLAGTPMAVALQDIEVWRTALQDIEVWRTDAFGYFGTAERAENGYARTRFVTNMNGEEINASPVP